MWDTIVYPVIELLFLVLFCLRIPRRKPTAAALAGAAGCMLLYIGLRLRFLDNYDAVILVSRILFLGAFCFAFFDVGALNSLFLCACLSLLLHAIILFYYNLPFLSHLAKQWRFGDALLINLLRGGVVLCLQKTVAEAACADIAPIEYLLVFVSYLGYVFDIGHYIALMSSHASTLEASVVLFMYCLATILSVVAALWHIVSRTRQAAAQRIQEILRQQYAVWNQKAERDAAIRRMYHDIRRQITLIENLDSSAGRELTDALRRSVNRYACEIDTGNAILNTLLNEKAKQCAEKGIAFSCVTQFPSLNPLEGLDLCAIVGNALDNAIEACERLADAPRREISMRIFRRGAFLIFRFENPFDGTLRIARGQYLTSKADPQNHGIGLSSIRCSVQKYGGEMTIEAENGRFVLKIAIPTA